MKEWTKEEHSCFVCVKNFVLGFTIRKRAKVGHSAKFFLRPGIPADIYEQGRGTPLALVITYFEQAALVCVLNLDAFQALICCQQPSIALPALLVATFSNRTLAASAQSASCSRHSLI